MSIKFTKRGIVWDRTDRIHGLLDGTGGGVCGRKTLELWETAEADLRLTRTEIQKLWDVPASWNDGMTVGERLLHNWIEDRVIRIGTEIH